MPSSYQDVVELCQPQANNRKPIKHHRTPPELQQIETSGSQYGRLGVFT